MDISNLPSDIVKDIFVESTISMCSIILKDNKFCF